MIRVRLAEVLGQKKISNLSSLARKAGLNRHTLKGLYDERAKGIQFETLARLCSALECTPGDLLQYSAD